MASGKAFKSAAKTQAWSEQWLTHIMNYKVDLEA